MKNKYKIVKIGFWTWQIAGTVYIFDSFFKSKAFRDLTLKNKDMDKDFIKIKIDQR